MSSPNQGLRVAIYVDGFNLYHAIDDLGVPKLKWLNLQALGKSLLRDREALSKVHYFTTIVLWDPEKRARHRTYVRALEAVGVTVHYGKFKESERDCWKQRRSCPFREEKQTDVAIGVKLIRDAFRDEFDRAILITADTDQIPTIQIFRAEFPDKKLTWVAPPERASLAREIGTLVPDRTELQAGHIGTCRLAHQVLDHRGEVVSTCPPEYR